MPDFQQVILPVLKSIQDGKEHRIQEVIEITSKMLKLTDEDRTHRLPSGKQYTFDNRVGWARTYLKKAGLLTSPSKGSVQITPEGIKVLESNPKRIDKKFLEQFPGYVEFAYYRKEKEPVLTTELTPEELLERSYQDLRNKVAQEILERVKGCSPEFFERLVVDLLVAMGYGGSRIEAGQRVGKTGDGGIDGIIKEDKLGLDVVNIQAKR